MALIDSMGNIMKYFIALLLIIFAHAEDAPKQWPAVNFKYVVGYCYDYSQDARGASITFPDGSLHKGVIRATTVRLNDVKVAKLRTLLSTDSKTEGGEMECYEPHHAFVFYDENWKVVASIDICFLCEDYNVHPSGASNNIDLDALELFCREVGLPVFREAVKYTELYKQEQANADVKSEPNESDPFGGDKDDKSK